jgi:hypothetical protein
MLMSPFTQAVKVARQLLSEGRTGADLANGLHSVASILSPDEKRRLASRISREYLILGHAAHDPNMFKTCQAAKEAKENSKDPNLKILTYKTPMCGSCGFNRNARCGLMGGTLIDGPDHVPEKAVHKTADILIANRTLGESEARTVEMGQGNATSRVAGLHDRKIKATTFVGQESGIKARIASRRAASILEPAESFEIKPKRLTGPARKVNAESLGLGVIDNEDEDTGPDFNSMFGSDMHVDVPANIKDDRFIAGMVDSNSEIDAPSHERTSAEEEDQEVAEEIQASFIRLAGLASRMLSEGAMSTRTASKIYQKMQLLQENGARHTRKTARIERQIDALGGGMQL